MIIARVEPVCVIDSVGGHAAKAATDAQRSAARAEAEDRVRAASLDAMTATPRQLFHASRQTCGRR
jgi:hypothetical protein